MGTLVYNVKEDNVVGVLFQTIKALNLKITKTTIREYLLKHPYYPSLKSVCDAFTKWQIESFALDLNLDEMRELKKCFIAHRNIGRGQIVLVKRITDSEVVYSVGDNKTLREDIETFSKFLSGAVILFEPSRESRQKDFAQVRQNEILDALILPLSIVGILILVLGFASSSGKIMDAGYSWRIPALVLSKLFGLVVSLFLVLHELKVSNPFVDKICHMSGKSDCNAVLGSESSRVFGWINWADFGFIYFMGGLLFIILSGNKEGLGLLAILSVLSIPYPVFSMHTQLFRIKRFCPLCMTVQLVLIAEFIMLIPELREIEFSMQTLLSLLTCFGIPALLYLLIRLISKTKTEVLEVKKDYYKFKRNPRLFIDSLLKNEKAFKEDIPERLILGNPEKETSIHAFLSLYCHPCALAFSSLLHLVENCNEVSINVILVGNKEDHTINLLNYLHYLRSEGKHTEVQVLLKKWYHGLENRTPITDEIKSFNTNEDTLLNENEALFKKFRISGTPTILIGNYAYPGNYNLSDLEYYIDEIRELQIGKQKAGGCITE